MPAHDGGATYTGPASANLQGRKPRWGGLWRRRGCYGDLSMAKSKARSERSDRVRRSKMLGSTGDREGSKIVADELMWKRCRGERDRGLSKHRREQRAAFRRGGSGAVVMRCRS